MIDREGVAIAAEGLEKALARGVAIAVDLRGRALRDPLRTADDGDADYLRRHTATMPGGDVVVRLVLQTRRFDPPGWQWHLIVRAEDPEAEPDLDLLAKTFLGSEGVTRRPSRSTRGVYHLWRDYEGDPPA